MKKLVLLGVIGCVAAGVAFGQAQTVTSVNAVGFIAISVPPASTVTMVCVNWDPFDPTFQGVFGTNQLTKHNTNPGNADRIYVWNNSTKLYGTYIQKASNSQFVSVSALNVFTNPPLDCGDAFWIRQPSSSNLVKTIYLMGEVVDVATQQTVVVSNLNMFGYPFSADVAVNSTGFKDSVGSARHNSNPGNADRLYIWNWESGSYQTFGLRTDGWHNVVGYSTNALATNIVSMGKGFWYRAISNAWTWAETNTYLQNL